jgi:hypothetical protein
MKKMYLALAASIVGLTLLGGCGKDESAPAGNPSANQATPTAQQVADQANKAAAGAGEQTRSVSAAMTSEAQKLMADATAYIKDKKFDLADQTVKKLEEMKPQLPAEYGPKIDQLRTLLNSAKATGGIKIPGM